MNLIEHLKNNGATLSVSNVKKGTDISQKVVSLTKVAAIKEIKEAAPSFELRYSEKTNFFDFNKSILTRLPSLNEDGIGFAVIQDSENKIVYLYLCSKDNELNAVPKIMATKNGKNKSLKFKSAALLYFGTESGLFKDETVMYRLVESDEKNLFTIELFSEAVPTKQLDLFQNIEAVEVAPVIQAVEPNPIIATSDILDEAKEKEEETIEEDNDAFSYDEEETQDDNDDDIMNIDAEDVFSIVND